MTVTASGARPVETPLRRRMAALGALGLAATAMAALALQQAGMHLGGFYALKAALVCGAVALAAVRYVSGGHPFARVGPANGVTMLRAMLVALVAALIGEPRIPAIAGLAAAAGIAVALLDGVDGWLARRTRMASEFGARFDMEVDTLLMLALAVLAWQQGKAGAWILLSGLLRYAFVAAGWLAPWLGRPLPPSFRRKAACVVQIAGLSIVLAPAVDRPASDVVAAAALLLLSGSFLIDVVWLRRRTRSTSEAGATPAAATTGRAPAVPFSL